MGAPAYDTLESVMNAARVRVLDAAESLAGDILTDTNPQTLVCINSGWRKLQEQLSKLGFRKFTSQAVVSALAVVANGDPATQTRLDWNGYFNGATTDATKTLPSDFITPIGIDERINSAFAPSVSNFTEMDDFSDSALPMAPKQAWNKGWEWRGDAIYFPGALSALDIRLRYWSFAADFVASSTTAFSAQLVPILRCQDAFANYIAAEFARARGDIDGKQFTADGDAAAILLVARENPGIIAATTPAPAPVIVGGQ